LRSFHYSFYECDAKLPFLEFHDAVDGATRGSGDGVFEQGGMIAGFEDDAGGAFHGLCGEKRGDIAWEADFDASFGKRFEDDVGEGRTAGGKAGDCVHVFFVDDDGAADGVEESLGDFEVFGGGVGTFADAGHASADDGTGVRHGADDGNFLAEALLDVGGGNGGGDGDYERVLAEFRLDLFQDVANDLRFYSEEDDVGATDGFTIVGGGGDTEFLHECGGFLFMADGGGDVLRREEFLPQVSAKKDSTELARAEDGEFLAGKFAGHGANIVTEARRRVNKRMRRGSDRMQNAMRKYGAVRMAGLGLAIFCGAWLLGFAREKVQSAASRVVLKDVAVSMRDGVVLRADVWLPKAEGRFPTLVYRTPYGKEDAPKEWSTFEKLPARGYAVVIQDVRGRYASDGEFLPYQNEGKDGYDTIEWAARQPWSDGNVGTFGLSYPGAVQWLAAVENPLHLKAMVPAMTFSTPRNFFYSGGLFDGSWLEWIWMNIAPDARKRKNLPGPRTEEEARAAWKLEHERLEGYLPLRDLPDLKQAAPFYYQWLAHAPADPWWDWAELRNKYDRVHCAVLNFSGWYDEAYGPDGATTNFNGLLAARKGAKDTATRTIIGPWTHGAQDTQKSGEREFGPTALVDYDALILRWMDHYVRGMDNGIEREAPVRIFAMGTNTWRDEKTWPLERAQATSLFLAADSVNSRVGKLLSVSGESKAKTSSFHSDPAHPVADIYGTYGAHDYRALIGREDVLVFDSEPMAKDTEVTGPITAEMYVSAEVKDFDLWVRLLDVAPDGTAFNLMSPGLDALRASWRDETVKPELLEPGKIYRLTLDRMLTSNTFLKGHTIRVQISGAFYPHFSRNLQTGESEIESKESRIGRIVVHHDAQHASRIILPIVEK
jgi:putative CocE/NonD family hydrolase